MKPKIGFKGVGMRIKVLSFHFAVFNLLLSASIVATPAEAYKEGLKIGGTFKQHELLQR
jgi:hypothetical protein